MFRAYAVVIMAALGAAACGSTTSSDAAIVAPSPGVSLAGTQWVAAEIDGVAIGNTRSTLSFDNEARAAGSTGCNRFFASVTVSPDTLRFGSAGSTRMACEAPFMEQETRFLAALEAVRSYRMDGTALLLIDERARTRLKLTRSE